MRSITIATLVDFLNQRPFRKQTKSSEWNIIERPEAQYEVNDWGQGADPPVTQGSGTFLAKGAMKPTYF